MTACVGPVCVVLGDGPLLGKNEVNVDDACLCPRHRYAPVNSAAMGAEGCPAYAAGPACRVGVCRVVYGFEMNCSSLSKVSLQPSR